MPNNIAGTANWVATIQVPVDGDPRNAASVATGMGGLADRTQSLKSRLDSIYPSAGGSGQYPGVSKLRVAETLDAIRARGSAGLLWYDLFFVPGHGIYTWDPTSISSPLDPWVILPTGHVGAGRWIHMLDAIIGIGHGLAQLDADGQVRGDQLANRIASTRTVTLEQFTPIGLTTIDIPGTTLSVSAAVGDIILASATFAMSGADASQAWLRVWRPDGVTTDTPMAESMNAGTVFVPHALQTGYTVTLAGSHMVMLRARNASTGGGTLRHPALRVLVIRPY